MLRGLTLNGCYRMGIIKQVQRGTITCGWPSASGTFAGLKKFVPENTVIRKLGVISNVGGGSYAGGVIFTRIYVVDSTTIGAEVNIPEAISGSLTTVSVEVIEYYPGVVRVQRDAVTTTGVTTTKAINPVVMAKSTLESLGWKFLGGVGLAINATQYLSHYSHLQLTASNQVTLTMDSGYVTNHEHGFQVTEMLMHGLDS